MAESVGGPSVPPARADLPAGELSLLLTDIEGSTRLLEELGDAYGDVLDRHRSLLRTAVAAHGGTEVDTQGDALFVVFTDAAGALRAAVHAQVALAAEPWPGECTVRVRMGIHRGVVTRTAEGYVGLPLHLAARVSSAAHGGQVLLTAEAAAGISARDLPPLRSVGRHHLKDVGVVELFQLVGDGLDHRFPPPRARPEEHHNLGPDRGPLYGRDDLLAQVEKRWQESSVLTLVGPGGVGKTRMAVEVARRLSEDVAGGAWLVDLEPCRTAVDVAHAVLGVLDVGEVSGDPVVAVVDAVADRPVVIVLDGCERAAEGAADVVDAVARGCPSVKVLATSQEALRLPIETVVRVDPLPVPSEEDVDAAASAAVRLFADRAGRVDRDFELGPVTLPAVAAICRSLDGLPLAIELAAACCASLRPSEVASRLGEHLRLLDRGTRGGVARHRTMTAAIAWSYELLGGPEQRALRRLGVVDGSFTLDAAGAVCGDDTVVIALLDRSLVHRAGDGTLRLLSPLRSFAAGRLDESGERTDVEQALVSWVDQVLERCHQDLMTPLHDESLDLFGREEDAVATALALPPHLDGDGALLRASRAAAQWEAIGRFTRAIDALHATLDVTGGAAASLRAQALARLALLAIRAGDGHGAIDALDAAERLTGEHSDGAAATEVAFVRARLQQEQGDLEGALVSLQRAGADDRVALKRAELLGQVGRTGEAVAAAEAVCRRCEDRGDDTNLAVASLVLASTLQSSGDLTGARAALGAASAAADRAGSGRWTAEALVAEANLDVKEGRATTAVERCRRAVDVTRGLEGDRKGELAALNALAAALDAAGEAAEALPVQEEVVVRVRGTGDRGLLQLALTNLGVVRARHGAPAQAMVELEEALALARGRNEPNGLVHTLHTIGCTSRDCGDLARAEALLSEAVAVAAEVGDPYGQVATRGALGSVVLERGDAAAAVEHLEWAAAGATELGWEDQQVGSLINLAKARAGRGDLPAAGEALSASLDVLASMEHPDPGVVTDAAAVVAAAAGLTAPDLDELPAFVQRLLDEP